MYMCEFYTNRIYTEEAPTINQQRESLEDSETKAVIHNIRLREWDIRYTNQSPEKTVNP